MSFQITIIAIVPLGEASYAKRFIEAASRREGKQFQKPCDCVVSLRSTCFGHIKGDLPDIIV
ncbi:hypothetical protein [Dendronalium sp. ChiSLP03b]|uniref:hypothetical protein n=1 Tax=Dendronalium sp. ChiSLP03b TaxID=3075381 RepID=UPI002AD272B7|nr:hypothetical protein [Dendronalium sp. ChiSLP03b]MDZ8208133.1 hypothetical protein [Dendronalium sp. ChiSLP03b]